MTFRQKKHTVNDNQTNTIYKQEDPNINDSRRKKVFMNSGILSLPPGYTHVQHTFDPVFNTHSRILILGSFPSVKSRENQFYYGHPQNRFWKLMARLLNVPVPQSIDEKKTMLLTHGLALWDVIASCDIKGSSDSSIKNAVPADISRILKTADIHTIITNGGTAFKLYGRYCEPLTGRPAILCPSTSPANAAFSLERLAESWEPVIKPVISGF